MSKQGTCSTCGHHRWISSHAGTCRPCSYPMGVCVECSVTRKIYVSGFCYMCYQHYRVDEKLKILESGITWTHPYNAKLFDLYLKYIRRYRLNYGHLKQINKLVNLLDMVLIPTIFSWNKIYELDKKYFYPNSASKNNGSAFIKIGYMLQELGLLPPRETDFSNQIENLIKTLIPEHQSTINDFLVLFKKTNPSEPTIRNVVNILTDFLLWWSDSPLDTIEYKHIELFLAELLQKELSPAYLRKYKIYLNLFFKYCLLQNLVFINPCKKIRITREAQQLTVCSEDQIRKLFQFIKSSTSAPEEAFLISLFIIFGLRLEDITFATISFDSNQLQLILKRKKLTKGKRYYNREQVLKLPTKPEWFFELQKRFYNQWIAHYKKIKKSYPQHTLLLPNNDRSNRPIHTDTASERVKVITSKVLNSPVTARVLRQTCGHIYSRNQDASILTQMGWSPQFAFHYTWLPRRYFVKNYKLKF